MNSNQPQELKMVKEINKKVIKPPRKIDISSFKLIQRLQGLIFCIRPHIIVSSYEDYNKVTILTSFMIILYKEQFYFVEGN